MTGFMFQWLREPAARTGVAQIAMVAVALNSEALREQLGELLTELALVARSDGPAAEAPADILAAFGQLMEILLRLEGEYRSGTPETRREFAASATELGEFAFTLLDKTERILDRTPERKSQRTALDLGFAYWVARHGGDIRELAPLVDAVALLANRTQAAASLADLATVMLTLIDTAAPTHAQDLDNANPGRPWRLLHLNLGIVATRAGRADLMELAFARLVTHLPQDAAQFFHQGMQQVERIDYPESVRAVMQNYFQRWGGKPALH